MRASVPAWILLAHGAGLYHLTERRIDHSLADELAPVFMVTTVWMWLLVLIQAALLGSNAQLLGPGLLWVCTIAAVLGLRAIARAIAQNRLWFRRTVVVVGDAEGCEGVVRRIRRHPEWGLDLVATVRDDDDGGVVIEYGSGSRSVIPRPVAPANGNGEVGAADLAQVVERLDVDRAIVTAAGSG